MGVPGANPECRFMGDTSSAEPSAAGEFCDLCGNQFRWGDDTTGAYDATGLIICTECTEAMLDASTDDTRTEVGLA